MNSKVLNLKRQSSFRIVKEDEKLILEGWLINDYQQLFNKLELRYELDFNNGSTVAEFKIVFDLEFTFSEICPQIESLWGGV